MKRLLISAAALIILASSSAALAKNARQEEVPYAIKARCETLSQKFDAARGHASGDVQAARAAAEQGEALCRAGRYEEGGEALAKALRMIGESAN